MGLAISTGSLKPRLRGIDDQVRSLPDALEEITRDLLSKFVDPSTSPQRQREISGRLALVRTVAGERNYAVVADRIQVLLTRRTS